MVVLFGRAVLAYLLCGGAMRQGQSTRAVPLPLIILLTALLTGGFLWVGSVPPASPQSPGSPKSDPVEQTAVLVGAGDIVGCQNPQGAMATAKLVEKIPGTVFALGDLVYDALTLPQFQNCYGRSWGKFKARTRPAPGNHEYRDGSAAPYYQYWAGQAGPVGKGYYSYDLGAWHVVVLNTNCEAAGLGGCASGSPQDNWLRQDLADHRGSCIIAYGHHALFSSGIFRLHAVHPELKRLWEDLYAAHADLILAGHEHSYERFAPQDPEGRADPQNGIREIVVGTGGRSHDPLGFAVANSEKQNYDTYGVLKLTLSPQGYLWEFIPEEGKSFRDSGSGVCHNRAPQQARVGD
jgi:acid phosphatase type 7